MKVSLEEINSIQAHFPDLYLSTDKSKISGELSFNAWYDGNLLHLNPVKYNEGENFHGYYEIEILLDSENNYGLPSVFETGGKIIKFSRENKIPVYDLHINGDRSCCLGIFLPNESLNMTIYKFVTEIVFSFFAWQAYATTFKMKPPWGEYSHNRLGVIEKKEELYLKMLNAGRNDPCPCDSGFKFKKCCLDSFQAIKSRVK